MAKARQNASSGGRRLPASARPSCRSPCPPPRANAASSRRATASSSGNSENSRSTRKAPWGVSTGTRELDIGAIGGGRSTAPLSTADRAWLLSRMWKITPAGRNCEASASVLKQSPNATNRNPRSTSLSQGGKRELAVFRTSVRSFVRSGVDFGAPDRIRTCGLCLRRAMIGSFAIEKHLLWQRVVYRLASLEIAEYR